MSAAKRGGDAIVRMLLEHGGSDVDAADDESCTIRTDIRNI